MRCNYLFVYKRGWLGLPDIDWERSMFDANFLIQLYLAQFKEREQGEMKE